MEDSLLNTFASCLKQIKSNIEFCKIINFKIKEMKKLFALSLIAILGGLIVLPTPIRAQEDNKKEKKVRIKSVKEVDGKKIVTDTTIWITDDMDIDDLKKFDIGTHGDDVNIEIIVDSHGKHKSKKVIIMKGGDFHISGDDHGTYFFHSDDGEGDAVVKWITEDGEEMEFNFDLDMESVMLDLDNLQEEIAFELKMIDGDKIIIMNELRDLDDELRNIKFEVLTELDDLHELKEYNIRMVEAPHHPEFHYFGHQSNKVSDVELRDAGIKNKPNRLDAQEIEIEIEDGVVDLYFKLAEEGNPKVIVYNVYGDKVFSGKPEKMSGKFSMRMDLSQKQHGTYYLQVVMGNSSFTEKLRL